MPASRAQEIDRLFAQALELPPSERRAFVEATSREDVELCREVCSLLEAHEAAGSFLGPLDSERAAALIGSEGEALPEERVGAYRLLRELGRGGMGVVYLAERSDGQVEQRVALKLIKRGADSDEVQRRFLMERRILARLEHPGIARLIDAGVSARGSPYFAMEYVDGTPLQVYCDERRLDVDARVRLFREIARAVRYAHGQLVVHRDLKPSNILVTAAGEPKLLDFGIAKLLDTEEQEAMPRTRTGLRLVTPEYGAPEQIRGEPVTTATDVYALGVILYELLCGHRPYRFPDRTPEGMARVITEIDPEKPSAVGAESDAAATARARGTTPARLRRWLRGDLDTIVMKALRKEPTRRYDSVEALLDDLERHATGLPVKARPDTVTYRTVKFVRRHRVGVGLAALVVVSILTGMTIALWQASVASREAAKAKEVLEFLIGMLAQADPGRSGGENVTARKLLEIGAARIETELAGQPEIQAEMLYVVGGLSMQVGLYDESIRLLEGSLERRRHLYGNDHPDVADSARSLAATLAEVGQSDRATALYREALAILERARGPASVSVAETLSGFGITLAQASDYDAAIPRLERALTIRRSLPGDEGGVAGVLHNLGQTLKWKGDYAGAEPLYKEALSIRTRLLGPDHPNTTLTMNNMGSMYSEQGRFAEAEPLTRHPLEVWIRLFGEDHADVALARNNLAMLLYNMGRHREAVPLILQAIATNRKAHGDRSERVATELGNLAGFKSELGEHEEAVRLRREALEIGREIFREPHMILAHYLTGLGSALALYGRLDEAESNLVGAIAIYDETVTKDHPRRGRALADLGEVHLAQGRWAEAETVLREAAVIYEHQFVPGHWRLAAARTLLGECLVRLGRRDEGVPLIESGYADLLAKRGKNDRLTRRAAEARTR